MHAEPAASGASPVPVAWTSTTGLPTELLDRLSVAVFVIASDGRVLYANESALRLRQLTSPQVFGRSIYELPWLAGSPSIAAQVRRALARALAGERQRFDVDLTDDHGQPLSFAISMRAAPGADGGPDAVIGEAVNISTRKQIEAALRESQAEIAKAQRLARVGSWSWIVDGDFMTWSAELYRMFGLDARRWPPNWAEHDRLYAPESFALLQAAVHHALDSGQSYSLELEFVRSNGVHGWLFAQGEAERDAAGRVVRLRGTMQDITERRRLQEAAQRELVKARELAAALEERSQLEREIVQFLAHEIRQPLNNASAALQSAGRAIADAGDHLSQRAQEPLSRAESVLVHVIGALNNSLAAATLLMAGDTRSFGETDLDLLTNLVLHDLQAEPRRRVRIDRRSGARTVRLQINLVRLALCNLLGNALTYSPPDSPVVLRVDDSDDPLGIVFDVVDEGGGIPPEILERAFVKGVRGPNAYSRPGAGLGLYIVRRVALLHEGSVDVVGGSSAGHCVRLFLPQGLA